MIRAGLALAALALVLHLAGGREAVSILSGTMPGSAATALLGLAYAAAWFAAVLLAPPLCAAGLVRLVARRRPRAAPVSGAAQASKPAPR